MSNTSADHFAEELRAAFAQEAQEQVQSVMELLIKLEGEQDGKIRATIIEKAFRDLHNLKGSARAVSFASVEALCHPMESLLSALKTKKLEPGEAILDLLLTGVCTLRDLLNDEEAVSETTLAELQHRLLQFMKDAGLTLTTDDMDHSEVVPNALPVVSSVSVIEEPAKQPPQTVEPVVQQSENLMPSENTPAATVNPEIAKKQNTERKSTAKVVETMRIPTAKLDLFMQKAEEMLSIKAMARQQASSLNELQQSIDGWQQSISKSAPEIKAMRALMTRLRSTSALSPQEQIVWRKINDLLETNSERIEDFSSSMRDLNKAAHDNAHSSSTAIDILLDETKRLVMMPCGSTFEGYPLLVRQLARELNKEVDLTMSGGEIEIDKRILLQIKDPLVHILRNSIDHGIEPPDTRMAAGKTRRASIKLDVRQVDGSIVEIRITDDGRGINLENVKATALKMGLTSNEELAKMSREQMLGLIFHSSLSTAATITEISGRGIGLAIVEENIRKLGGRVRLESEIGKGTTFVISLPLTIATFRGVLVDASGRTYIIPTTSIERVVRVKQEEIKPVEGHDTILLGSSLIPVCRLEDALELPVSSNREGTDRLLTVSILGSGANRMGFIVDEVLEEQEVLVKSLGKVLSKVKRVSGVTILGSGKVVPILNVTDMLRSHRRSPRADKLSRAKRDTGNTAAQPATKGRRDKKVLVVDDTLTARILLRNIFESAGFQIKTMNDGLEGLAALRAEKFDVVVTDIEMPNMNGFEFTEAIRKDPSFSHLPVIMVTSMTSREDRERGVAAGASAYFVKSSFDQTNLLDVIDTLV